MNLIKTLIRLDAKGGRVIDGGAIIKSKKGYISGAPYTWTAFRERAFVFRDVKQARQIKARFKLRGRAIKAHEPS